tara:strand:- start:193 stop:1506 length:1314 start_codon:yes stop_codon:yes gene_type:complete
MKLNLASKDIKAKTPPKKNSYYVADTVERRLLLKVHPLNKDGVCVRSYHWSQGKVLGVRKRPQLARLEETTTSIMRNEVQVKNRQSSDGINPYAEDLKKLTFNMFLMEVFMPNKQQPTVAKDGTRLGVSEAEYKNRMSMINAHIKEGIGKVLVKDMTYQVVDGFLSAVAIKSPSQARNIRVFLVDAWREALRQHQDLRLPNFFQMWDIKNLNKKIKKNKKAIRPLEDIEGPAIYNAIEKAIEESSLIGRCVKMISLVTTRKMNVAKLMFDDVKLDKASKKYYFDNSKQQDNPVPIFLGEDSQALLEEIKQVHRDLGLVSFKHIFPQFKNGRYVDVPITDSMLRTVWEGSGHGKIYGILGDAAKEAPTLLGTKTIPKFTLHDFRDTAATYTDGENSQLSLGHKHMATTEDSYKKILKSKMSVVAAAREGAMKGILKKD